MLSGLDPPPGTCRALCIRTKHGLATNRLLWSFRMATPKTDLPLVEPLAPYKHEVERMENAQNIARRVVGLNEQATPLGKPLGLGNTTSLFARP
jgi:hypothetical protein